MNIEISVVTVDMGRLSHKEQYREVNIVKMSTKIDLKILHGATAETIKIRKKWISF